VKERTSSEVGAYRLRGGISDVGTKSSSCGWVMAGVQMTGSGSGDSEEEEELGDSSGVCERASSGLEAEVLTVGATQDPFRVLLAEEKEP
jgi:hypothetical protein